jgi:hypothetical protein
VARAPARRTAALLRLALGLLVAALLRPADVRAQSVWDPLDFSGYYLNVGTGALEGPFTPSGATDLQRLRLMLEPDFGPLQFDVAYEQSLELVTDPVLAFGNSLGYSSTGVEWLPLQWTIDRWDHGIWRHRFDRLALTGPLGPDATVTAGRQAVSWATSLIFTPADPFSPFDPADPFREYRAGVDALRVQGFAGAFTQLDFVVRPADTDEGTMMTALGRITTATGPWEVSGWAGVLYDGGAASVGATLTAAGAAFRGEAELRWPDDVLRFAVGVDRSFTLAGRELYVVLEYQRDGYGATDPVDYPEVRLSGPYRRGEMQVIGRNEAALQGSWQVTPLWTADWLTTWNLDDGSFLLSPAASYSLSNEAYLRAGLFFGIGADERVLALPGPLPGGLISLPGSEYGIVPTSLYVSLTAFF